MKSPFYDIDRKSFGLGATACLLAILSLAHAENASLPQPIPEDHYQPIWARSPFTIAVADDDAPKGTWALVGLTQDGEGPLVIVLNRQTQERVTVTNQPNQEGFSVETVDFNPDLLQSSARIKTPAGALTVHFDQALTVVSNAAPASNQSPTPGRPASGTPPRPPAPGGIPYNVITHTTLPHPLPKAQPPTP